MDSSGSIVAASAPRWRRMIPIGSNRRGYEAGYHKRDGYCKAGVFCRGHGRPGPPSVAQAVRARAGGRFCATGPLSGRAGGVWRGAVLGAAAPGVWARGKGDGPAACAGVAAGAEERRYRRRGNLRDGRPSGRAGGAIEERGAAGRAGVAPGAGRAGGPADGGGKSGVGGVSGAGGRVRQLVPALREEQVPPPPSAVIRRLVGREMERGGPAGSGHQGGRAGVSSGGPSGCRVAALAGGAGVRADWDDGAGRGDRRRAGLSVRAGGGGWAGLGAPAGHDGW